MQARLVVLDAHQERVAGRGRGGEGFFLERQSWLAVDLPTRCLKGIGDGQDYAAPAAGS
jgi:hypothetical protein